MCPFILLSFSWCLLKHMHRHTKTHPVICADRLLSNYVDIHCPHWELLLPSQLCCALHSIISKCSQKNGLKPCNLDSHISLLGFGTSIMKKTALELISPLMNCWGLCVTHICQQWFFWQSEKTFEKLPVVLYTASMLNPPLAPQTKAHSLPICSIGVGGFNWRGLGKKRVSLSEEGEAESKSLGWTL